MSLESPESRKDTPVPAPKERREGGADSTETGRRGLPGIWVVIAIIALIALIWQWSTLPGNLGTRVDYGFFREQLLEHDNVTNIKISDNIVTGTWKKIPANPKAFHHVSIWTC